MVRKLKIMSSCDHPGQLVDIEEAKDWNFYDPTALVVIENHLIQSYKELLEMASREDLKERDFLTVHFMITCTGG